MPLIIVSDISYIGSKNDICKYLRENQYKTMSDVTQVFSLYSDNKKAVIESLAKYITRYKVNQDAIFKVLDALRNLVVLVLLI